MSKNLVREALELFEDDDNSKSSKKSIQSKKGKKSFKTSKKNKFHSNSTIERYIKEKDQTNIKENLNVLKKLSITAAKYDLIKPAVCKNNSIDLKKESFEDDNEILNQIL